jgi:hypothetical protein
MGGDVRQRMPLDSGRPTPEQSAEFWRTRLSASTAARYIQPAPPRRLYPPVLAKGAPVQRGQRVKAPGSLASRL